MRLQLSARLTFPARRSLWSRDEVGRVMNERREIFLCQVSAFSRIFNTVEQSSRAMECLGIPPKLWILLDADEINKFWKMMHSGASNDVIFTIWGKCDIFIFKN